MSASTAKPRFSAQGFQAWLYRNRWLIVALLASFAVRLHWNLLVHPLGDYISSDMRGYTSRADQLIDKFGASIEYHAFFPYGTHFLLALLKVLFGRENYAAIGVVYALLGTIIVYYAYRIAERVSSRRWVPPLLAMFMVFYYPLISLGGYTLSEVPFSVFLLASSYALLRLVQDGRTRDAWWAGVHAGIATAFRPQILLSILVFGVVWVLLHRHMSKVRVKHLVCAAIPIAVVLVFSSARLYHHTGRLGLISENGRFNQLFGRCHNKKAVATPEEPGRGRIRFGPPPLIQLEKRAKTAPNSWVQLDPAIGAELNYAGYISDAKPLNDLMRKCIAKTGYLGQLKYAVINVLMLAGYNTPWPDSGRDLWRHQANRWQVFYTAVFTAPALLMMFTCFMRRTVTRHGILALHIWALLVTAAIYFGDTRLRAPYDPMLVLLAIEAYIFAGSALWGRLRRRAAPKPG
ncbi:glycosyltransferase family 39 protein [Nannocystis sp.]|uniref:ArnT family glycosyltransferase n=1 Tax=Nannocystis sp. TaxID=1962667 RepID=UPI0025FE50F4|nr:glycosyltransferase family 39 protein [Nannocystis sp.]MBK7826209.1 glycosyltransferase family 39 protein [Nannocystis sp.]